ncbi:arginine deiminase-related protein [Corallococcus sp. BB11-1]|uniref:dimethylarginine dimethylaminohydrolase family protein n=1 Tax=Corallococcus sp. BB11-1 TaxID=2996783 RepID=UPI002272151D|nr:arginine deiminase-related protein [Corallococcus sp. BB11-1]MCY1036760.1 arginine deiminase-related protein [Corallococcus sp. BB11-1]
MLLNTGHFTPATFAVSQVRCEKDHVRSRDCAYQVAWNINPHMKVGAVAWRRACSQHRAFLRALRDAGAGFFELPFVHGAFDSVFAKDNAVLVSQEGELRALLATMRHGQRRGEQLARARWLSARGFDVIAPERVHIEGGDVAMLPQGRGALLGFGQRSTQRAAGVLEAFLDAPVTPLELCDPYLYHLDTALTVLSDGTALVCPEAFTPDALRTLARTEGIQQVVPVAREDALAFGLNLVEVGNTVIVGARVPRVEALLRGLGRRPVSVKLDQFHLAGGSAACLAARVHTLPPVSAQRFREEREAESVAAMSA